MLKNDNLTLFAYVCKLISVGAAQVDEEEMSITAKARGI